MKKLNIIEIKKKARDLGVSLDKSAKKGQIIRAIQAAEGNQQCFGSDTSKSCKQLDCCWRPDCLEL